MKNWNTTAKIKAIIIAIVGIYNLVISFKPFEEEDILLSFISPLVSAIILMPVIILINARINKRIISRPKWNDSPFGNSLAMAQFFAWFFFVVGICMIISTEIKFQVLNTFGLTSTSLGLGIFIGIFLTLLIFKKSQ